MTITAKERTEKITAWIKNYAKTNKIKTLVVGVSGGIDSAVVSTLCARTKLPTYAISMPIKQIKRLHNLSQLHCKWLEEKYSNVLTETFDLTPVFKKFENLINSSDTELANEHSELAFANSRARLRMMTLYQIAQSTNGIVVGTGNKVEDFGVGFFTKWGDGGVDISPIGDCMKTQVWDMGKYLKIDQSIIDAPPTDGLWNDGRTDEDQIGVSYSDLELAMNMSDTGSQPILQAHLTASAKQALAVYNKHRSRNLHKMLPIPVCKF